MKDNVGPSVTLRLSCFGCKFCDSVRYAVQGDSGLDYYCKHPERIKWDNHIGDSRTKTPSWCPLIHLGVLRAEKLVDELDF